MNAAERDAKITELTGKSEAIRSQMQDNTNAARRLNEANRELMKQRREIERALHAVRHVKVEDDPPAQV